MTWAISSRVCDNQNPNPKPFLAKIWCFPNPDQVVFVPKPNQTISKALKSDKIWKLNSHSLIYNLFLQLCCPVQYNEHGHCSL